MARKRNLISLVLFLFFCIIAGGSFTETELKVYGFIFLVVIVGTIIYTITSGNKRKNQLIEINESVEDFNASLVIKNCHSNYSLSIDKNKRKILIAQADHFKSSGTKYIIDFKDIISVELNINGSTMYSKSTMRTIGGGVVGGVVAGGAGAIVGGLSGASKGEQTASKISVKILVRNNEIPSINLICYEGEYVKSTSLVYEVAVKEAESIVDNIRVIIDMIDKEENINNNNEIPTTIFSVADELDKLNTLKEKGVISETEFRIQKEKILSKN